MMDKDIWCIDEYIEMWNDNLLVGDGVQYLMNTLIRKRKLDKIQFKQLREELDRLQEKYDGQNAELGGALKDIENYERELGLME